MAKALVLGKTHACETCEDEGQFEAIDGRLVRSNTVDPPFRIFECKDCPECDQCGSKISNRWNFHDEWGVICVDEHKWLDPTDNEVKTSPAMEVNFCSDSCFNNLLRDSFDEMENWSDPHGNKWGEVVHIQISRKIKELIEEDVKQNR